MFSKAATVNDHKRVGKYAESVSGYILKCVENVSTGRMKNVSTRASEKPWMTQDA